jgi:hypothetical protein
MGAWRRLWGWATSDTSVALSAAIAWVLLALLAGDLLRMLALPHLS